MLKYLITIVTIFGALLFSTSALADYNCNVDVKLRSDKMSDANETLFQNVDWLYDVPDFRTSGTSRLGNDNYGYEDPFGDAALDMLFPSRVQNCINKALDKVFPNASAAETILDQILAQTGNINAKGLFCTQPQMWKPGGDYLSSGLRFKFSAQKILNRKRWLHDDAWIKIPKSYCAAYYNNPPCPPDTPAADDEGDNFSADDVEDIWQGSGTSVDNSSGDTSTNPTWTADYNPPQYCEAKPFILLTGDEGKTNYHAMPQYPVDMNGDGLSDVVLRWQHPQNGLTIRTRFSNGDGTFRETNFTAGDGSGVNKFPALVGYLNNDRNTDLLLRWRHPTKGLMLRTKFSNGDGTYQNIDFQSGDGSAVDTYPAFIGDVDGDGLSDLILRYQHASEGWHILVKFSNGDGTFRSTDFKAGDGRHGNSLRAHVADINGDKKTDLVYLFQDNQGLHIRTRLSNGDGTFAYKHFTPGGWISVDNIQSFVGDFNRDRKSDLVLISRNSTSNMLSAKIFFSQNDGTYHRKIIPLNMDIKVDEYEALAADVNGDRRTDIIFRLRDPSAGLKFISYLAKSDGTFDKKIFVGGDGDAVDAFRALIGTFDRGRKMDIFMRHRHAVKGLINRTRLGNINGVGTDIGQDWGDGPQVDILPALTGPMFWNGGATFSRCGGPCTIDGPAIAAPTSSVQIASPTVPLIPDTEEKKPVKIKKLSREVIKKTGLQKKK